MIYTDDPRTLLTPADRRAHFSIDSTGQPVDITHTQDGTLTIHFDPFEAANNPGCPFCYAPVHRLRLFDVEFYSYSTPPFTWVSGNVRRELTPVWRLAADTRAVEYSPCPHVIAPYNNSWPSAYTWPTMMTPAFPSSREWWGVPAAEAPNTFRIIP